MARVATASCPIPGALKSRKVRAPSERAPRARALGGLRSRWKWFYARNVDPPEKVLEGEATSGEASEPEVAVQQPQSTEEAPAPHLLELVLAAHEARSQETPLPPFVDGVVVARVVSVDAGVVRVAYPGAPEGGAAARVMTRVTEADVGRDAALLFEGGQSDKPIVMGLLFEGNAARPAVVERKGARASVDGERVVLSAEREIVLECGEASITLTRAGKILIKGTYVLTRSSGTNRIQGGSVEIN